MQTNSINRAVVWSQPNCVACNQAKTLLEIKGIDYEVKMLGENATKEELLKMIPTARSVPQIFINGRYVGGLLELRKVVG